MVLHIREPSIGDISRTSHSDERYVANHYAPPMRQAIPIKAFAGEEIKIYILDNIKQHRIHIFTSTEDAIYLLWEIKRYKGVEEKINYSA